MSLFSRIKEHARNHEDKTVDVKEAIARASKEEGRNIFLSMARLSQSQNSESVPSADIVLDRISEMAWSSYEACKSAAQGALELRQEFVDCAEKAAALRISYRRQLTVDFGVNP